jgi:hypothetical protein
MTLDDARIIAELIGFADRGCSNCVGDLVEHANRLMPKFSFRMGKDPIAETYLSKYDIECTDWRIPVTVEHNRARP